LRKFAPLLVVLLLIACVGFYFGLREVEAASGFEVTIVNNSGHPIQGDLLYLDQKITVGELAAGQSKTTALDLNTLRKQSTKPDQVGGVFLNYQVDQAPAKQLEVFGYIEPGDSYLLGKEAIVTVDQNGNATVKLETGS